MSRIPGVRIRADAVELTTPDAMARLIASTDALGEGFRAPLFRAAQAGVLATVIATSGEKVPARMLKRPHPVAVVVADDHPGATGPAGWPQAAKLMRWARLVAIHATGGQPEHYEMFAIHAVGQRCLLVVEVELRHVLAWRDLALRYHRPGAILLLLPPEGGSHPVQGAAEAAAAAGATVQ